MIITAKAFKQEDVNIDADTALTSIVEKLLAYELNLCGYNITPDEVTKAIKFDPVLREHYILKSPKKKDTKSNRIKLPEEVAKIRNAWIILNHAIYKSEQGNY